MLLIEILNSKVIFAEPISSEQLNSVPSSYADTISLDKLLNFTTTNMEAMNPYCCALIRQADYKAKCKSYVIKVVEEGGTNDYLGKVYNEQTDSFADDESADKKVFYRLYYKITDNVRVEDFYTNMQVKDRVTTVFGKETCENINNAWYKKEVLSNETINVVTSKLHLIVDKTAKMSVIYLLIDTLFREGNDARLTTIGKLFAMLESFAGKDIYSDWNFCGLRAFLHFKDNEYIEAKRKYTNLLALYPDSKEIQEQLKFLGAGEEVYLEGKKLMDAFNYEAAKVKFEEFLSTATGKIKDFYGKVVDNYIDVCNIAIYKASSTPKDVVDIAVRKIKPF